MPNLYPGIHPLYPSGQRLLCLCLVVLLPGLIFAQPTISSVSPLAGPTGSSVTITGSNFNATPASNIVYFGSVMGQVTAASSGSLTVTAPVGNSYLPLTVNSGGLTAFSYLPFVTTFTDSGQFNAQAFATRTDFSTGSGPQSIYSMDLDGDGKPDLMVADGDSNTVEVYQDASTPGTTKFSLAFDYILPSGNYPVGITAGDLDGDGKPEIIVTNYGTNLLFVFENTSTPGSISFAAPVTYTTGNYTLNVTVADVNMDGKPDIIVPSATDNIVSVFTNNSTPGNLSFPTRTDLPVTNNGFPVSVIVADLDGDGMPDLATANTTASSVSVFRNTGTPGGPASFATNVDFPVGNSPNQIVMGDLNGDGKPDLATANNGDNTISLLRNTSTSGTMSFYAEPSITGGNGAWSLILADLNGDGKPDLASVNQTDNTISVFRNISTTDSVAMAANVDYPVGDVPWYINTADYDGDGMPDIATIGNTVATISVLLNKSSAAPAITSFTPTTGISGTVVTITGMNLGGTTAVTFGGTPASSFTVVSPDTITATLGSGSSGLVAAISPGDTATLGGFTYGVPPPVITSFSPDSGTLGTTVMIYGQNLSNATTVTFGGVAASFTVVSDSVLSAVVGTGATGMVFVTSPSGPASLPGFTYTAPPPPPFTFVSFSPTTGTTGTNVIIKGTGLLNIVSVLFGGVSASSVSVISDSMVIATVGTGASGEVTITNTGNGIDSLPGFTYTAAAPPPPPDSLILTSFSPGSGASGASITINGENLTGVTGVSFGGVPAQAFSVLSDSQIVAVVGAGASGAVTVASPNSTDSLNGFLFLIDTTRQSAPQSFQLLSFTGALNSGQPQLQWTVQDDAGIAYYAVERSMDSLQFSIIGTVSSIRSNGATHSYSLTDPNPAGGINYYRLRMQDTTANYTYSNIISIQLNSLPVYPNPVKYGFFYVDLPNTASPSQFQLSDMTGRVLQVVIEPAGLTTVRIDMPPGLPSGTYVLNWTNGNRTARQTILVLSP